MRIWVAMALAAGLSCHLYGKDGITKTSFGRMEDGAAVDLYTLKTGKLEATIANFGSITQLRSSDSRIDKAGRI